MTLLTNIMVPTFGVQGLGVLICQLTMVFVRWDRDIGYSHCHFDVNVINWCVIANILINDNIF